MKNNIHLEYGYPSVEQITSYLVYSGWKTHSELSSSTLEVFMSGEHKQKLLLPKNEKYTDYANRVAELFKQLSILEKRDVSEIVYEAHHLSFDVTSFRFVGAQYNDGTIPLEKVSNLIRGVLESFTASTKAVNSLSQKEKKPRHKYAGEAAKLMHSLKMGQTQKGSYIVNILTPIPTPKVSNEDMLRSEIPYPRLVTQQLSRSISALREAAKNYTADGNELAFLEAQKLGVNGVLCDALIDLGETDFTSIEVSSKWSKKVEVEPNVPTNIKFHHDILPAVQKASAFFKKTEQPKSAVIFGKVQSLRWAEEDSKGTITVSTNVEGVQRVVTIKLEEGLYQQALKLHGEKRNISLYGDLDLRNKQAELKEPYMVDELNLDKQ